MSVRETNRKQTGRVRGRTPEVILTQREDGTPGVTLRFDWETYVCYTDPEIILQIIHDLDEAHQHLLGTR